MSESGGTTTKFEALHTVQKLSVLVFWGGILYYALSLSVSRARFGIAFLGGAILIYLFFEVEEPLKAGRRLRAALFGLMGVTTVIITAYMYVEYKALINVRVGYNTQIDYLFAVLILGMIIYLTYREYGLPFVSVIALALLYAYFGPYFPSWLQHSGLGTQRILQAGVLNIEGAYGNLTRIMGTWIALFLLYAGMVQGYGAFDLIMRGAKRAGEVIESGVAQAAVVSSIAIGSVNGSATANTGITGSITIDIMKRHGIKAETAAAIEAVSSSGGQIMPPVMGAAAFLMASLLSIPFSDVLVAGIVPALIFYIPVVFSVHYAVVDQLNSKENDFEGLDLEEKNRWVIAWQAVQFVVPFGVLLYTLGILQYSIMYSALITNIAMVLAGFTFPLLRQRSLQSIPELFAQTYDGLERGARSTAPIAIVIASIGFIVDILLTTGIPTKLSLAILQISGGTFLIAIVLALIVSIILGMGMPTSAAYLIVALLVAPSLVRNFAVPELAVHFFVFYAAILSALTPPIAVGIVVASGIAESDFWKTTAKAFRIGFPAFLLPFVFMYHPEIVIGGLSLTRMLSGGAAVSGMILIAYAANSNLLVSGRIESWAYRIMFIATGIGGIFLPSMTLRVGALMAGVLVFLAQTRISEVIGPVQG